MAYSIELKTEAKRLFCKGYKLSEIKNKLNLSSERSLYNWAKTDNWADLLAFENPLNALDRRLNRLYEKLEGLTDKEQKELDRLIAQRKELVIQNHYRPATDKPLTDREESPKKKRTKPVKNDIASLTKDILEDWFNKNLFEYQKKLWRAKNDKKIRRSRNILKSRQIGLTWYFAREAFADAVLTGDNQIFLSASKNQAKVFRTEIISFAQQFGIELSGADKIVLSNGATLYFLSTNSATAQSYHGHLYIDEYFWIPKYKQLKRVADGMATHDKWRKTYLSTASTLTHQAYSIWSGDEYLNRKDKHAKNKTWPSIEQLHQGYLCPDGTWRLIIDIDDAIAGGLNLVNLERLKLENTPDVYNQLYKCQFIDETQSVFKLHLLEKCLTSAANWADFNKQLARPYGDSPVWIGYDPSRTGDMASCVVIAAPQSPGDKFLVLEKFQLVGQSFAYQAAQIKKLTEKYNVTHIGIDITGIGYGVYDLVKDFYPRAVAIHYSLETKTTLVLKALDVISAGRLLWDASLTEIGAAFLTIKQTTTPGGLITYSSNRTATTGHADIAWAIMHALFKEPLNTNKQRKSRYSVIESR